MTRPLGRELLAAAKLGAPKGVRGALKVQSYSGEFDHLASLEFALLGPEGKPELASPMRIAAVDRGAIGMSIVFAGYDSPEKARALTGMELFLPREAASPLAENEWYIHDLVGLKLTLSGEPVGEVVGVLDGGADPLLEIKPAKGGAACLVPFRGEFIGAVDVGAGTMELLAGWLLE
ncbi:ribosome maturation factor RimM [bacterium]|nr:ribosome maturation factor RimM [bacterium]